MQARLAQGSPVPLVSAGGAAAAVSLQQQLGDLAVLHRLLLAREARLLRALQQV